MSDVHDFVFGQEVKVYKAAGRFVRDPATSLEVPVGGTKIKWNSFWERRLTQGDIDVTPKIPQNEVVTNAGSKKGAGR